MFLLVLFLTQKMQLIKLYATEDGNTSYGNTSSPRKKGKKEKLIK